MSTASNNKIINICNPPPNPVWGYAGQRTRSSHLSIFSKKERDDFVSFADFVFQILGIDMNFEKWKEMNSNDKKSLIREIKLKKIVKDDEI